jgi:hypothetical protein
MWSNNAMLHQFVGSRYKVELTIVWPPDEIVPSGRLSLAQAAEFEENLRVSSRPFDEPGE